MITGGVKFFDDSPALLANGGTASVTSGTVVGDNMIDKLRTTHWRSVGSSDVTTETIVLTFVSTIINRLLFLDLNWKGFVIKYWNGSAWTHFTSVTGIDGAMTNVTETAFADDSCYYEVASVTTTGIQITITTTQTANEEKYLGTALPCYELGTLTGFPLVAPYFDPRARVTEMLSGLVDIEKQTQVFSCTLTFENYPVKDYGADVGLMLTLIDRENPFYIWPCGGHRGSTYFSYAMRGWRLQDCFRVGTDSGIAAQWAGNLYKSGLSPGDILFRGHV